MNYDFKLLLKLIQLKYYLNVVIIFVSYYMGVFDSGHMSKITLIFGALTQGSFNSNIYFSHTAHNLLCVMSSLYFSSVFGHILE